MTLTGLLAVALYLQSGVQVETAQIHVRVLNLECHPIPGANVTLTKVSKEPYPILSVSTTDRNGDAFVPASVNQGGYEVSVELANYTPTRVGPFGATKGRADHALIVVLNFAVGEGQPYP